MPTLKIVNNSAQNPITVDLSNYLKLGDDGGVDPADPNFTQRIFSRSLLKEGATLALQQLVEKEQQWPVLLGPYANQPAMMAAIAQINQAINTPGAVLSWQDDGVSQPTYFDLLSGELQIEYSYRKGQRSYTKCKLLTFSQPLGRTAGSRPYAAASGVGPLLMISPYASGGALAIGASTQGGVAGFGGAPMGASSGVFYPGAPSLAGDAPALLQVSYVGPLPVGATVPGVIPYAAVSLLPDALYRPLLTAAEIATTTGAGASVVFSSAGVASMYLGFGVAASALGTNNLLGFNPLPAAYAAQEPTGLWAGPHRIFAIARASSSGASAVGYMQLLSGPLAPPGAATVTVQPGLDWQLYDMGTISLRPSEYPSAPVVLGRSLYSASGAAALDLAAIAMLPDNATWFLPPTSIPSQMGPQILHPYYTNTLLLDDPLGDQFVYGGASQSFAPSPLGSVPSSMRITQFTRGLVPRPDPKNGLPIIAVLSVAQAGQASQGAGNAWYTGLPAQSLGVVAAGASWTNPQNLRTMAQVNVLERVRYVLP